MNEQNKIYKFASAVSFTVEETLRKIKAKPHRRFDLVVRDACHHFDYSFDQISKENGYSLDDDYSHIIIQKEFLMMNLFWPGILFLNIGPDTITFPEIIEVGDMYISFDESISFKSDSESVLFYRNLRKI
jgi:hypothetical protein